MNDHTPCGRAQQRRKERRSQANRGGRRRSKLLKGRRTKRIERHGRPGSSREWTASSERRVLEKKTSSLTTPSVIEEGAYREERKRLKRGPISSGSQGGGNRERGKEWKGNRMDYVGLGEVEVAATDEEERKVDFSRNGQLGKCFLKGKGDKTEARTRSAAISLSIANAPL